MDRFNRFYALHRELSGARVPKSREQLRQAMDCSAPTFKRTLREMRNYYDAPIKFDAERGGYHYSPPSNGRPFELPGLWFSAAELHALLSCQQLLSGIAPGLFESHLAPLRERIDKLLKTQRVRRGQLAHRVRIVTAAHRLPKPETFTPVAAGVLERRQLDLAYRSRGEQRQSYRTVSPQRLVHYRDN